MWWWKLDTSRGLLWLLKWLVIAGVLVSVLRPHPQLPTVPAPHSEPHIP